VRVRPQFAKKPGLQAVFGNLSFGRHVEPPVDELVFVSLLKVGCVELLGSNRMSVIGQSKSNDGCRHMSPIQLVSTGKFRNSRGSGKLTCSSRTVRVSTVASNRRRR